MEKYIIVIGGVISGVGKGVATASIGRILQEYGYSAIGIKIDPYINYDAGTLRPTEHGEVWVTDDGGEIDQDLGNYERFLNINIPKKNNITTGQIYSTVIERERRGQYLGQTVQFIPHIPDEIKSRIRESAKGYDITLIEVGGTVGDYENIPFLFAIKGMEREIGKENVIYVLITYLPIPSHIEEMKTKPTQQAIKLLSQNGIIPDIILCRGVQKLDDIRRKKIETYANIKREFVISAPDIKLLYEIPLNFESEHLGEKILEKLCLKPKKMPDWKMWIKNLDNIKSPDKRIKIGMIGKYLENGDYSLKDVYISINEALIHAGARLKIGIDIEWIDSSKIKNQIANIKNYDGIIIPGGFGIKGIEGKILAIKYARENKIPFLGLCLGMQLSVVEYARNVAGLTGAYTTEIDKNTQFPVVDILPSQKKIIESSRYGGTMRLGAYAANLKKDSLVYSLYEKQGRIESDMAQDLSADRIGKVSPDSSGFVIERHRHRFEVNPEFVNILQDKGLVFSGWHIRSDGTKLMEFLELKDHPFFVATQSHPEFKSRFLHPAPLFLGFVEACTKKVRSCRANL